MIFVQGGTFQMGDIWGDSLYTDEQPLFFMRVADFRLAATETTFDEYDAFCRATGRRLPSDNGWGRGRMPVLHTDWYDAAEYCNWRSQTESLACCYRIEKGPDFHNRKNWKVHFVPAASGYRLPTEAEWEYAARAWRDPSGGLAKGGGRVRFGNSTEIADPQHLNFRADSAFRKPFARTGLYRQRTVEAGALPPNTLGLHEMSGNLFEWCADWYAEDRYRKGEAGPSGTTKVARGGSWFSQPAFCRAAYRFDWPPDTRCTLIGFRIAQNR
jgi:formylglycine-generating enzyme required for sulfatase activity